MLDAPLITLQLRYLQREFTSRKNNFVIYLFILTKAAKWQLLTLLFRKSEGDNKSQICDFSRYFRRKGKNLVANATVLVVISSPETMYPLIPLFFVLLRLVSFYSDFANMQKYKNYARKVKARM